MQNQKPEAFLDLHGLPEDTRIRIIGNTVRERKNMSGFFVEDDKKAERYIKKLTSWYPDLRIVSKEPFNHRGVSVVLVKVDIKVQEN